MEHRSNYRFLADTTVNCRVPASPECATISDVSQDGCRLCFSGGVALPGSTILLELLPGFHAIGHVMWQDKSHNAVGIRFETPLDETLVEHVRAGNG